MRRALPALLLLTVLGLAGCSGDDGDDGRDGGDGGAQVAPAPSPQTGYSEQVRGNFLDSCLENATRTAEGAATQEQLTQTCACILGKVEQEYSEAEFAEFEKRLLGGDASDEESGRLVNWSTECARASAS